MSNVLNYDFNSKFHSRNKNESVLHSQLGWVPSTEGQEEVSNPLSLSCLPTDSLGDNSRIPLEIKVSLYITLLSYIFFGKSEPYTETLTCKYTVT